MSVITLETTNGNGVDTLIESATRAVIARISATPQDNGRPRSFEVRMGVSNRHMHLCRQDLDQLFGEGYQLKVFKELYQKGYFAAMETVMVVGQRRCLPDVRILGPLRPKSQVELSLTDAISLGLKLGVAESGTDPVSQPVLLVGPKGRVELPGGAGGGAYIARRHLHISPEDASVYGLKEGDLVKVRTAGDRAITLHGVLVRIKEGWSAEIHLDTDEANAAGLRNGELVTVFIPSL